jgi:nitrite reductase (NADH) small subunit
MERIGRITDFPEGEVRLVDVEDHSVGVIRRGEEVYGILNICPHRAAPVCEGELTGTMLPSAPGELRYGMEGLVLRCPWHGWEFDIRTGESVGGVDSRRLRTCTIAREGEFVLAGFSQAAERRES